jgi:hypothetical protein
MFGLAPPVVDRLEGDVTAFLGTGGQSAQRTQKGDSFFYQRSPIAIVDRKMTVNNRGYLPRRNILCSAPKLAARRSATYGRANNRQASGRDAAGHFAGEFRKCAGVN